MPHRAVSSPPISVLRAETLVLLTSGIVYRPPVLFNSILVHPFVMYGESDVNVVLNPLSTSFDTVMSLNYIPFA